MKKYKLLFLLFVLFLASCSKIKYGHIKEKWYEPSRTFVALMPVTISSGKVTTTVLIPYTIYDNEDYCIKVEGFNKRGKIVSRTYYINKNSFDTLYVGKYICVQGNSRKDKNNKKIKGRK